MKIYDSTKIINCFDIKKDLPVILTSQKAAFVDFSSGRMTSPMPLQMYFDDGLGDCHIKAGYKQSSDYFVVKIATGFYAHSIQNPAQGDGALILFSQKTGLIEAIFLDKGFLTTLRTAVASLIAHEITPWPIKNIGIIGTGALARQIIKLFGWCYPDIPLRVYGRSLDAAQRIIQKNQKVSLAGSVEEIVGSCDFIITATASKNPLIHNICSEKSLHIVALGADDLEKREIDASLFGMADRVIIDSKNQAQVLGDCSRALKKGILSLERLEDLGQVLESPQRPLKSPTRFMITDLTGIVAQDIAIGTFVLDRLQRSAQHNL